MASSSRSTPLSNIERDVLVSYCFQDTGTNFTSHLKSAFDKERIITFIDDRQDGGEEISESLSNNISESLVSVLVFSENYGGSPRCLNELLEIVRCMREYERHVLPVFRGVEPSHVQKQEGAFGEAFQKMLTLNQQLKADKEEKWRSALVEAADLSGWDSQNTSSEADMINKVVERIKVIVNKQYSEVFDDGFVGIEQVKKVESLLHLELTKDVQSLGIWGTGGVGKTTIARKVYSRIKNQFNGACFLSNVGDRLGRKELDSLCNDMLKELLRSQNLQGPLDLATMSVKNALRRIKFLIVFDDVTYSPQLKDLVKPHRFYGPGSRIILTSRDKQMLKNFDCKEHIYEVKELNHPEALRLFKFHAFTQQPCSERYKKLSEKALRYAKGLPLALEVLGCNLHGKQVEEWESELEKLEEIPDRTINDILMISFAGLDKMEKRIFLDIACVFLGWRRDQVETILNEFYARSGISRLHDKALISISNGILGMHDLLKQMGQAIVLQECEEEPGRLSRIWRYKDFYGAVTQSKLTRKVEVISVDLSEATDMVSIPKSFEKLLRLRVLNLYNDSNKGIKINLPEGFRLKSDKLAYIHWDNCPSKSLLDKSHLKHLAELELRGSSIERLWSGEVEEPYVPNLKVMDLSYSKNLISLPDFSRCPNLSTVKLVRCYKLREVPSSIQCLGKLWYLDLNRCRNLKKLPELPQNIKELGLSGTGLKQLPSSIGSLIYCSVLDVFGCKKLRSLPESIGEWRSLTALYVDGCSRLTSLPESLGKLQSLAWLRIRGTAIKSLPSFLCKSKNVFDSGQVYLQTMDLTNSDLRSLPASIEQLPCLLKLCLDGCKNLRSIPDLPSTLRFLSAEGCISLRSLGSLFGRDRSFGTYVELNLLNCISLDEDSRIRSMTSVKSRIETMVAEGSPLWPSAVYIPGGRVPEWVEYREEGSSVKLKLWGCCTFDDLSHLLFCVVYSPCDDDVMRFREDKIPSRPVLYASCKCLFLTEFGLLQLLPMRQTKFALLSSRSEHMILWHQNIRMLLDTNYRSRVGRTSRPDTTPARISEVTFEFEFTLHYYSPTRHERDVVGTILRCGVTPLGRNFETGRGKRFLVLKV